MTSRLMITGLAVGIVVTIGLAVAQEQSPAALQGNTQELLLGGTEELTAENARLFSVQELARIRRGFQISPVPLNLQGKNPFLVGLGSYNVNAKGGCNDCHTNPSFAEGGNPFMGQPKQINAAGYLAGGNPFGPEIRSRNLTPDPQTGLPGGLTYEQFSREIRTGEDVKNLHPQISPLLQVMPWPVYQDMTERDLRSIYEFLRAIPHAEPTPTPPSTP
jgi:hypothetical protein